MRVRRVTLITALAAAAALVVAARLRTGAYEPPEVRLHRLLLIDAEPHQIWKGEVDSYSSGIAGFQGVTWRAEFEIRVPPGNGIVLADGDLGVEMLGLDGHWTPATVSPTPRLPFWSGVMRLQSRIIKVSLPGQPRSCRFTVGFRPLTFQERYGWVLSKWGLRRRFPKTSAWLWDRLPSTEQWSECRRELEVPPFPIVEDEARDERLQATRPSP